jgi:ComF family protein
MGYVVKTQTQCFGIDLYHKHAERLAPMIDFMLITHNHSDHYSKALVAELERQGKGVYSNFMDNGHKVTTGDEFTIGNISIKVNTVDHNATLKNFVNTYEVNCYAGKGKPFVFLFTGDAHNYTQLSASGKVNVFIPHLAVGLNMAEAVKKYKFSGQWLYGELFGKMIHQELKNIPELWEYDCIIPVPLHANRLKERGYNQSEIMGRILSELSGLSMIDDGIFRIRETKRQSSLVGLERRTNVKGAFFAAESAVLGKRIILVDDICTMGETLRACGDALLSAGAREVVGITLCVSKREKECFDLY